MVAGMRNGDESQVTSKRCGRADQDWLSTTADLAVTEKGAVIHLTPASKAADLGLTTLSLGRETTSLPQAVHVGADDRCEGVLAMDAAKPLHCQFALRRFSLCDGEKVYEALFLRDVAEDTFVNGKRAYVPWHWLHDGDEISLPKEPSTSSTQPAQSTPTLFPFINVRYCSHQRLPKPGASTKESASRPAAKARSAAQGRGRGKTLQTSKAKLFKDEVIGKVVEVNYGAEGMYRVKVTRYDPEDGFHHVDSTGYSRWEDEEGDDWFEDTINLNSMVRRGLAHFVEEIDDEEDGDDDEAGLRRSDRKRVRTAT